MIPLPTPGVDQRLIDDACGHVVLLPLLWSLLVSRLKWILDIPLSYKHVHWEQKGIPLIIFIGEVQRSPTIRYDKTFFSFLYVTCKFLFISWQVLVARRDNLVDCVAHMLKTVQNNIFEVAKAKRRESVQIVNTWEKFVNAIERRKPLCFATGRLAKTCTYWSRSEES